jgi:biopolymer transport protein TolR
MAVRVSGGGSPSRDMPTALAEINVTPLVDVMLVLLIVFMVAAPLLQQGIAVDLPKASGASLSEAPGQVSLTIDRDRELYLDSERISAGALPERLSALATARPDVALFVQADASIPYGYVAQILAEVRRSKIQQVGLVTDASEAAGSR